MHKPSTTFPRTFKPATVNRINAINKGLRRIHVKLSRSATKRNKAPPSYRTPCDADCFVAKRYARTLDHLTR